MISWRVIGAITALALTAAAPPATRTVSGSRIIPVRVGSASGRLLIDPGGTAMPLIDAAFAARAGLRPSMFGVSYSVGPVEIPGYTAVARVDFGRGPTRRRVGWAARRHSIAADAMIGPGGLPEPIVRFVLRPAVPGERVASLPMVSRGGLAGRWGESFALIAVGGQPMRVQFDLRRQRTVATAGAGLRLAQAYRGRLSGPTGKVEIAFGVERPVRSMTLESPLMVGALAVRSLGIRTVDFGNASGLQDSAADSDEIVVTALRKRNTADDRISIGRDDLARCSSITFDKRARRITLSCR